MLGQKASSFDQVIAVARGWEITYSSALSGRSFARLRHETSMARMTFVEPGTISKPLLYFDFVGESVRLRI
jgi:hypothetical protein